MSLRVLWAQAEGEGQLQSQILWGVLSGRRRVGLVPPRQLWLFTASTAFTGSPQCAWNSCSVEGQ